MTAEINQLWDDLYNLAEPAVTYGGHPWGQPFDATVPPDWTLMVDCEGDSIAVVPERDVDAWVRILNDGADTVSRFQYETKARIARLERALLAAYGNEPSIDLEVLLDQLAPEAS
jgi:hypothetical protein